MTRSRCAHWLPTIDPAFVSHWLQGLLVALPLLAVSTAAAPAWSPPAATSNGDVDEKYYSEVVTATAGTSDSATREQALAVLPLAGLSRDSQIKARQVLANIALYRRLPTYQFAVDPEAYQFLLQHPDVAVSSWRAMDISQFQLKAVQPQCFHADAQDGSVGLIEVWKSTGSETVIYCDGAFKSPLVTRPIQARSIMHIRTRFYRTSDGTPHAEHTGDVYVAFPSQTVETVARLISPVSHVIADRNFRQLTLYAHLMSAAMSRQPAWVESIVRRMDATEPQKQELLQLTHRVRGAAEKRVEASLAGDDARPVVRAASLEQSPAPGNTLMR